MVSYGPRPVKGVRAWDTFQTILGTAKKLGVNFFHYVRDRIANTRQMPALADLIRQRAKEVPLGPSWSPS